MRTEIDERTKYLLQNHSLIEDSAPPEAAEKETSSIVWECLPEEEKQRIRQMLSSALISSQFYGTPCTSGTCFHWPSTPVKATPIPGIKPY